MPLVEEALFITLCGLFDELESISKGNSVIPKRRLHIRALSRWFDKFSCGDVYTAFRLLIPEIDLKRVYYLKETKLAALMCEVLGLSGTGRGKLLQHWRADERLKRSQGDLSMVLFDLIRTSEYCAKSEMTLKDLSGLLDEIVGCKANKNGFVSFDGTRGSPAVQRLYSRLTSKEVKWVTRLILKDLRLNIEPRVFFDAFHGSMWRIYSNKNDLKLACDTIVQVIKQGYTSASKISASDYQTVARQFFSPKLGVNIAIMACGRAQGLQHVVERLTGNQCFVEQKYDGERMQAHLCKAWPERIKIFSKSGRESTKDRFRCHEQLLRALKFDDPVNCIESCIVEGELLVFNEKRGEIETFGTVQNLQAHKSAYRGDICSGDRHYLILLFDLLYLNGQDLTFKSLKYRRALLETLVIEEPKSVELVKVTELDFAQPEGLTKLSMLYTEALVKRWEGLIIKKSSSPYLSGNRSEWLKLKKDYIEGFGDTAEFVVVGVSHNPQDSGRLTNLIIGALTNKEEMLEDGSVKPRLLLVFTVRQGLNEEESLLFHERVKELNLIPFKDHASEEFRPEFAAGFKCPVDFILKTPIIAELLGSGFVRERGQPHHVLRFPRIRRICFNRPLTDSLSFQELQDMAQASFTSGNNVEALLLTNGLHAHSKDQQEEGRRAPTVTRPKRLVFREKAEDTESPSKLIKTISLTEKAAPGEDLRKRHFIHIPHCTPDRARLMLDLEQDGFELLHHVAAVAACENRKCVIVFSEEADLVQVKRQLSELGCERQVFRLSLEALQQPSQLTLDKIVPL